MSSIDILLGDSSKSPLDIINELKSKRTLADIRSNLHERLSGLDDCVDAILNSHIDEFISVTKDMSDVSEKIESTSKNIALQRDFVDGIKSKMEEEVSKIRQVHQKLNNIKIMKSSCADVYECLELLSTVEESLNETGDASSGESAFSQALVLESISKDVNGIATRVKLLDSRFASLPCSPSDALDLRETVASLGPKLASVRELASAAVSQSMGRCLGRLRTLDVTTWRASPAATKDTKEGRHVEVMTLVHLARALVSLQGVASVVEVVREVFVSPVLVKCMQAFASNFDAQSQQQVSLAVLLNCISEIFGVSGAPLAAFATLGKTEIAACPQLLAVHEWLSDRPLVGGQPSTSSIPGLHLLSAVLLSPVCELIEKQFADRVAPAFANRFAADVFAIVEFVIKVNKIDGTIDMRSHAADPAVSRLLMRLRGVSQLLSVQKQKDVIRAAAAIPSASSDLEGSHALPAVFGAGKVSLPFTPVLMQGLHEVFTCPAPASAPTSGIHCFADRLTPPTIRIKFAAQLIKYFVDSLTNRVSEFEHQLNAPPKQPQATPATEDAKPQPGHWCAGADITLMGRLVSDLHAFRAATNSETAIKECMQILLAALAEGGSSFEGACSIAVQTLTSKGGVVCRALAKSVESYTADLLAVGLATLHVQQVDENASKFDVATVSTWSPDRLVDYLALHPSPTARLAGAVLSSVVLLDGVSSLRVTALEKSIRGKLSEWASKQAVQLSKAAASVPPLLNIWRLKNGDAQYVPSAASKFVVALVQQVVKKLQTPLLNVMDSQTALAVVREDTRGVRVALGDAIKSTMRTLKQTSSLTMNVAGKSDMDLSRIQFEFDLKWFVQEVSQGDSGESLGFGENNEPIDLIVNGL